MIFALFGLDGWAQVLVDVAMSLGVIGAAAVGLYIRLVRKVDTVGHRCDSICQKIDGLKNDHAGTEKKLDTIISKLDDIAERVADIDKRLVRVETLEEARKE